jgi:hypothetical protein
MFRIDFWLQSILLSILVLAECLALLNTDSAFLFVFLFLFLVGLTQFISCLYNAMVRQIFFFKKYLRYIGLYFGLLVLFFLACHFQFNDQHCCIFSGSPNLYGPFLLSKN